MTDDLKSRWSRVVAHLETALALLPASPSESAESGRVTQYQEFVRANELELALDELEGLGQRNAVHGEFWARLLGAAEEMGLHAHAIRYRQRGAE